MKLIANRYQPKDIFRIIREWSGLTQEEFGALLDKKGRSWAKGIESGKNRFYFEDILDIANQLKIIITFEKNTTKNE